MCLCEESRDEGRLKVGEVRRKQRGKCDEGAKAWPNLPLATYAARKLLAKGQSMSLFICSSS